jgi:ubiquinone/menaquinone biosynthesis C-methylase UbiE
MAASGRVQRRRRIVAPMFTYDFGYPWWLVNGHLIPLVIFGALLGTAIWRKWPWWWAVACGLVVCWSLASFVFLQMLRTPATLPVSNFLASDSGRVLDIGAGSGRLAIGILEARPHVHVTAVDIYSGYFGIADNTPDRLMKNARAGGVADRLDWKVADMRKMPFGDAEYDAAASSYAMDHVGQDGATEAVRETARVLKPGGEFLLMLVNTDGWIRMASLLPHHQMGHPAVDAARWRARLADAGFEIVTEGKSPGTMYFYSRKRS